MRHPYFREIREAEARRASDVKQVSTAGSAIGGGGGGADAAGLNASGTKPNQPRTLETMNAAGNNPSAQGAPPAADSISHKTSGLGAGAGGLNPLVGAAGKGLPSIVPAPTSNDSSPMISRAPVSLSSPARHFLFWGPYK